MNESKENTEKLLIQSFKKLMMEIPFDKITIKKITDGAGVIRPTFYNHFSDKYMVFETILDDELFDTLYSLVELNMVSEAISVIFTFFDKNKRFYRKAFEVTGQNSFEEILTNKIETFYTFVLNQYTPNDEKIVEGLGIENIARYYTIGLVYIINSWCHTDDDTNVEFIITAYEYLVTHALTDIFDDADENSLPFN